MPVRLRGRSAGFRKLGLPATVYVEEVDSGKETSPRGAVWVPGARRALRVRLTSGFPEPRAPEHVRESSVSET